MKKMIGILAALCSCVLALGLSACATEPVTSDNGTHTHTASVGYRYDERHHWRPCTAEGCNIKLQWAEHVFDSGVITTFPTAQTQGVRTFTCVCGQTKTAPVSLEDANNTVFDAEKMAESLSNVSLRVTAKSGGSAEATTSLNLCFDGELLSVTGTLRLQEITETVRDSARIEAYRQALFFFCALEARDLRYEAAERIYKVDREITADGLTFSGIGLRLSEDLITYVTCSYTDGSETGTLEIALFDYGNIRLQ